MKKKDKKIKFLDTIYVTYDNGSRNERILIAHENANEAALSAGDGSQCAVYQLTSVGTLKLHSSLEEEKQV